METKTIVYGILTLIVIGISIFFLTLGRPIADKFLGFGPNPVEGDTKSIQEAAEVMFSEFDKCLNKNSPEKGCLCSIKIINFPSKYLFGFSKPNTITFYEKGVIGRIEHEYEGNLKCYLAFENNKLVIKEPNNMKLGFKANPYVIIGLPSDSNYGEYNLPFAYSEERNFYKKGDNVCFIIPELLNVNLDSIKLSQCEEQNI